MPNFHITRPLVRCPNRLDFFVYNITVDHSFDQNIKRRALRSKKVNYIDLVELKSLLVVLNALFLPKIKINDFKFSNSSFWI